MKGERGIEERKENEVESERGRRAEKNTLLFTSPFFFYFFFLLLIAMSNFI